MNDYIEIALVWLVRILLTTLISLVALIGIGLFIYSYAADTPSTYLNPNFAQAVERQQTESEQHAQWLAAQFNTGDEINAQQQTYCEQYVKEKTNDHPAL